MATTEQKLMRKRLISAYVSSVFSISLVLLLIGVAALLLVNASNVSDYFKENMNVSVIFTQETSDAQSLKYAETLGKSEYVKSVEYVSREQGIKEMQELLGADFLSVFDTAPIPVSLNVSLKAEYVTSESLEPIMKKISSSPLVDDVVWQKSLVKTLNENLSRISLFLGVFILLLLFISFVLIANTVRLNLYSKRFSIHTMRLVGASKSFIRRPFLGESLFQGTISALFSIILLLVALIVVKSEFEQLFTIFQLRQLLVVMSIMLGSGMLICLSTTFAVVGRIVNLKKEELYF